MSDKAPSRVSALGKVASQINTDGDLDTILRALINAACEHGGWDIGTVMSIDVAKGRAFVMARRETSLLPPPAQREWELATSPALVALQKRKPVYIRDARTSEEFPGYRRDSLERGYCTVLVFPMVFAAPQSRPMVMTVSSQRVVDVSEEDMAFMSLIAQLGAIAIERAERLSEQVSAADQLRRVLTAQGTLLQDVLTGGTTESLFATLADMLTVPVLVLDFLSDNVLASASPIPSLYDDPAWRTAVNGPIGRDISGAVRDALSRRRDQDIILKITEHKTGAGSRTKNLKRSPNTHDLQARIEPLLVDDEAVGAMLTFGASETDDFQKLLFESAKLALSVHLLRSVIRDRVETRTLSELFFEIVERRWRDEPEIRRRGHALGLSLSVPMRILVVDFPERTRGKSDISTVAHRAIVLLAAQQSLTTHIVTFSSGLVCLVPRDASADHDQVAVLAKRVAVAMTRTLGQEPIVAMSETFEGLAGLADEWERCDRIIRIAQAFGRCGPIDVPALGPLPMLIGASDSADVRSFVDSAVGRIALHDQENKTSYLETLRAFIRVGCRSQPCADTLGLHVTTLRYRLTRISDLFDIKLTTPEERFAIELALRLHTLIDVRTHASIR